MKAVSIYWGAGNIIRQDLVFSPFKHKDRTLLQGGIVFERQKKFFHEINIGFSQYDPMLRDPYIFYEYEDKQTAQPHQFTIISLDYSMAKPVIEHGKAKILLGGSLKNKVQALNYTYGRISNFGYFASTGLGLYAAYLQQIGEKFRLSASVQLPLLSWLARSPYLVNDDEFIENTASHKGLNTFLAFIEDGQLASLNRFQSFDLTTRYYYKISSQLELGLQNQITFLHASRPRNLYSLQTEISLSGRFTF
ncbi:hypothetical protein D770_11435 [Flammeovirgaceae bacterium 311]|nr:hypothetical protein D770_11435 [Flammeovirgaceae bacterium 311]